MLIPWDALSPDTLQALIEEFVTRDGTDYGESEVGLEQRCQQVLAQLKVGKIVIIYTQSTGDCNIISKEQFSQSQS